jgi:hypothetical protein
MNIAAPTPQQFQASDWVPKPYTQGEMKNQIPASKQRMLSTFAPMSAPALSRFLISTSHDWTIQQPDCCGGRSLA